MLAKSGFIIMGSQVRFPVGALNKIFLTDFSPPTTLLSAVMGINTTTSALLYKHACMATCLEWWTVVASYATFSSASTQMGDPGFLRWCSNWVGPGLPQGW